MRCAILVAFPLLVASCGQPPGSVPESDPVSESRPSASIDPAEDPPRSIMAGRGRDLYMHDYSPTDGELRDPTFWVHADSDQLAEGEKQWSLQGTRAVIYRDDEEDLVVEALEGEVDLDRQVAELRGAVRLTVGSLIVDLEDLLWENEEGTATSDHPIHLVDENMRFDAESLLIKRDEGVIILGEGSGYLRLTESAP